MTTDRAIAPIEDVPADDTFLFTLRERESGEEVEAIALRVDGADTDGNGRTTGTVVGWRNYCQHLTDVRLDKGSGAPIREGEIVCTNHGALFEFESGFCTHGPCEGAYLNEVDLCVEDGTVYLDDGDYEFVDTGPIGRDPADLSSGSTIGF